MKRLETFGEGGNWTKKSQKAGGARGTDELGGVYEEKAGNIALIKRDLKSPNFDIAEFLSSKIFDVIAPGYGAKVDFVTPVKQEASDVKETKQSGNDIYVRSEFFQNYTDMFKDMDNHMDKADRPSDLLRKDGRPMLMGEREKFTHSFRKAFKELKYNGFDKIAPTSLLIGDFDIHTGNIGVIREKNKDPKLVRIDFGWGFANLTPDIHPHSKSRHLPGMGPTNHFREFPRKLKLNQKFVDGINDAANAKLEPVLKEAFNTLENNYSKEILQSWAKHAMPKEFKSKNTSDIKLEDVKNKLTDIMKKRQESIKEFGLEIELGLCCKKVGMKTVINKDKLNNMIENNKNYFVDIISGKKHIRFRDKKLNTTIGLKGKIKTHITLKLAGINKEDLTNTKSLKDKVKNFIKSKKKEFKSIRSI